MIKDSIKEKIASGMWEFRKPIPSEAELCRIFDVSPGTVKRALQELVNEGYLYRRQGIGSFVARPNFENSLYRFFRYDVGKDKSRPVPRSKVLISEVIEAPEDVCKHLMIEKGSLVVHIRRVRLFDEIPLVYEDLYLPHELFEGMEKKDISEKLLYPIYEQEFKVLVVSADEYLNAATANEEQAQYLGIGECSPLIEITRIARTFGEEPVEYRRSFGRGDRFRYHVRIR
ncbi:GntR family transcriptional regulator [Limisalsivibrio acetivorans]|uniref:GntR family transcriptional regulator n=1 Tax=Limisalsivibrio acetivorans TaxID=1304888 RepID=UPI0006864B2F|nr:GntR family transcriptional regulator [Limisalsivibrio acetivorans]